MRTRDVAVRTAVRPVRGAEHHRQQPRVLGRADRRARARGGLPARRLGLHRRQHRAVYAVRPAGDVAVARLGVRWRVELRPGRVLRLRRLHVRYRQHQPREHARGDDGHPRRRPRRHRRGVSAGLLHVLRGRQRRVRRHHHARGDAGDADVHGTDRRRRVDDRRGSARGVQRDARHPQPRRRSRGRRRELQRRQLLLAGADDSRGVVPRAASAGQRSVRLRHGRRPRGRGPRGDARLRHPAGQARRVHARWGPRGPVGRALRVVGELYRPERLLVGLRDAAGRLGDRRRPRVAARGRPRDGRDRVVPPAARYHRERLGDGRRRDAPVDRRARAAGGDRPVRPPEDGRVRRGPQDGRRGHARRRQGGHRRMSSADEAGQDPAVRETPAVKATGAGTDRLLKTEDLTMQFGGLTAIDSVEFGVREGELRCLIGPNGAGKSTLLKLITGRHVPTEGKIYYDGTDVTDLDPHQRVREGIGMKFQVPSVFESLTAAENVRLPLQRVVEGDLTEQVAAALARVGLDGEARTEAADLSHGQQQRLEIGMAAALDPNLLLLDEPVAGLSVEERREVANLVTRLNDEGITFVVIEHDIDFVDRIADEVTVLHQGDVFREAEIEAIRNDDAVRKIYLGAE